MIYVLDTDHLSLLGRKDSKEAPRIRRRIVELPASDSVVTTVINFEEQMRGWMAALRQAKSFSAEVQVYARLLAYLETFKKMSVLQFTGAAADRAGNLRSSRLAIGTMDLKIAAIVLSREAVLVTRNSVDFNKVPALAIEDWCRE
jgi:tRNA(fMet)-specific endonuclease VapC